MVYVMRVSVVLLTYYEHCITMLYFVFMNNFIYLIRSLLSKKTLSLSYSLAKTNFKLRNEGSYLGILWYLLNPLFLFVTILFVKQTAFNNIEIPLYPVYLLVGLVMLSYLNRVVSLSTDVIRSNSSFIKSIHIPTEVLVISSVLHVCMLHVFEIFLILCLAIYMHIPLFQIVLYFIATLVFTVFLVGLAFLFSTIGVYISDVGNIWAAISQLIFFVTPIFYTLNPANSLYTLNLYNPLYHFITFSRDMLIRGNTSLWTIQMVSISCMASLIIGLTAFGRYRRRFAEWL
jgi:ABC-type polysaccharide/polyol phosphate export permease